MAIFNIRKLFCLLWLCGIVVWRVSQTLGPQDGSEPRLGLSFITYSRLELLGLRVSALGGFVPDFDLSEITLKTRKRGRRGGV